MGVRGVPPEQAWWPSGFSLASPAARSRPPIRPSCPRSRPRRPTAGATRAGADEGAMPDDCERLLAAGDLNALLGLPLDTVTVRSTLGVAEPSVGRTERVACRYTTKAAGPARGRPLLLLNASSYTSAGRRLAAVAAQRRHRGRRAPRPADRQRRRGARRARRRGVAVGRVRPGHAHPDPAGPAPARRSTADRGTGRPGAAGAAGGRAAGVEPRHHHADGGRGRRPGRPGADVTAPPPTPAPRMAGA